MGRLGRLFGREPERPAYKTADLYDRLRRQALEMKPEQLGFGPEQRIVGVLIETGFPEGAMMMVALADGTASMYFSGGGGIIGAGEHPGPNAAARNLIACAPDFESACVRAATFPLPQTGYTRFYIIKHGDVLTAEAREEDLGKRRHRLSPLYYCAHDLITQIRLTDAKLKAGEKTQNRPTCEGATGPDHQSHPDDWKKP